MITHSVIFILLKDEQQFDINFYKRSLPANVHLDSGLILESIGPVNELR